MNIGISFRDDLDRLPCKDFGFSFKFVILRKSFVWKLIARFKLLSINDVGISKSRKWDVECNNKKDFEKNYRLP